MKAGDKFTIEGVKLKVFPNGNFLIPCKSGEETIFINAPEGDNMKPVKVQIKAPRHGK